VLRPRRRGRRRALIVAAIVVVILAGGAGGSALAYNTIKKQAGQLQSELTVHLQSGQTELEAAKASLKLANANHDEKLMTEAKAHFTAAKAHFTAARQIADSSQLLSRLEGVPEVGSLVRSRHTAVDGIADMGIAISDAGQELADLDGQLIKPTTARGQSGRTLLTVLTLTSKTIVTVRGDLDRAQKAAARVDIQVLPAGQQATFIKARGTIVSALAAVDQFQSLVPVITEVLGGNGARTYLIEQVNPAELRAGGGFIGTYSVLRVTNGTLKLVKSGNVYDLVNPRPTIGQPGYVQPPGPLLESLTPNFSWSFMDSNFFPDFQSSAKAAESFVQPRLGMKIDGVISMDYYTVATMLALTGPMVVPGYGITVNSNSFVSTVIQGELVSGSAHKAIFGAIAGPLLSRVATLPASQWPALISILNGLAASRHLQAYFNSATVEKQIDLFGWSGTLRRASTPDFMMEVESNLGATKANYFLTRHFTVELTRNGGLLHHKVTISLLDNMPLAYRPNEFYKAYLRLYVPSSATSRATSLRPALYPSSPPAAGLRLMDGWVPTFHGYGHTATAVFQYDTPWRPDGRGEDQIYWQKQPGTLDDRIDVVWKDGAGHTYRIKGDLGQDRVLTFSAGGITITPVQAAQAQLPSLSLG
jgi:Protein of unknown function (DUF4012)